MADGGRHLLAPLFSGWLAYWLALGVLHGLFVLCSVAGLGQDCQLATAHDWIDYESSCKQMMPSEPLPLSSAFSALPAAFWAHSGVLSASLRIHGNYVAEGAVSTALGLVQEHVCGERCPAESERRKEQPSAVEMACGALQCTECTELAGLVMSQRCTVVQRLEVLRMSMPSLLQHMRVPPVEHWGPGGEALREPTAASSLAAFSLAAATLVAPHIILLGVGGVLCAQRTKAQYRRRVLALLRWAARATLAPVITAIALAGLLEFSVAMRIEELLHNANASALSLCESMLCHEWGGGKGSMLPPGVNCSTFCANVRSEIPRTRPSSRPELLELPVGNVAVGFRMVGSIATDGFCISLLATILLITLADGRLASVRPFTAMDAAEPLNLDAPNRREVTSHSRRSSAGTSDVLETGAAPALLSTPTSANSLPTGVTASAPPLNGTQIAPIITQAASSSASDSARDFSADVAHDWPPAVPMLTAASSSVALLTAESHGSYGDTSIRTSAVAVMRTDTAVSSLDAQSLLRDASRCGGVGRSTCLLWRRVLDVAALPPSRFSHALHGILSLVQLIVVPVVFLGPSLRRYALGSAPDALRLVGVDWDGDYALADLVYTYALSDGTTLPSLLVAGAALLFLLLAPVGVPLVHLSLLFRPPTPAISRRLLNLSQLLASLSALEVVLAMLILLPPSARPISASVVNRHNLPLCLLTAETPNDVCFEVHVSWAFWHMPWTVIAVLGSWISYVTWSYLERSLKAPEGPSGVARSATRLTPLVAHGKVSWASIAAPAHALVGRAGA